MVDDSSADRTLCRVLLKGEYGPELDFLEAPDGRRGLEICKDVCDPPPDCLLLDYKLPDMTGVEFLRRLGQRQARASGRAHPIDLPRFAVVMLTGLGNEQVAVESMRAGAQDYLVKDRITSESLRLAIEKATGKIGLLRALQTERDRLAESLAEKDALLEEVHHRVKNNLQVIASLLRLQAEAFGDKRLAAALRESQNRVESMALIHEQLYETGNLREVDLAAHAALLANHLMHAYGIDAGRVRCLVQVDELRLPVNRAIPAALILNELLSNAMQHAFADGRRGTIEVRGAVTGAATGERRGKEVVLEVRDDGSGLPHGARLEPPQTLGLHIVGILTRQLHGAFTVESGRNAEDGHSTENRPGESGPGAVCRLRFPVEGESHVQRAIAQRAAAQRAAG